MFPVDIDRLLQTYGLDVALDGTERWLMCGEWIEIEMEDDYILVQCSDWPDEQPRRVDDLDALEALLDGLIL